MKALQYDAAKAEEAKKAHGILIDAEVLRVTAGNGTTTWTVSRGRA